MQMPTEGSIATSRPARSLLSRGRGWTLPARLFPRRIWLHRRERSGEAVTVRHMGDVRNAKNAAEELLDEYWDGTLPVDPVRIAKSLDVEVLDVFLKDNVSGALVKKPEQDPSILLNANDSKTRKRFTAAHELGHYVRRANEPAGYEYVDYRDQRSSTGTDKEERFANSFAANLLMPAWLVESLHEEIPGLRLARRFGVSHEAMHHRLDNLGLLK